MEILMLRQGAVFIVTGAAHTRYLRNAVGDVYEDGQWRSLDPVVSIEYDPDESIPQLVNDEINGRSESFNELPGDRINTPLLAGVQGGRQHNVTRTPSDSRPPRNWETYRPEPYPPPAR